MPAPYSDNIYSDMGDDSASDPGDGRDDALSSTDGYFRASEASGAEGPTSDYASELGFADNRGQHWRTSSHVPNVLVEDPTLFQRSAGKDKEAEAEHERLLSRDHHLRFYEDRPFAPQGQAASASASASSGRRPAGTSASSLVTSPPHRHLHHHHHHHHRTSVHEEAPLFLARHSAQDPCANSPIDTRLLARSATFNHAHHDPSTHQRHLQEAPPAYSPSATSSPLNSDSLGYQTFSHLSTDNQRQNGSSNSVNMGVFQEHDTLLSRPLQSMGGSPNGPTMTRWQRIKRVTRSPQSRIRLKALLSVAVVLSIFVAIFGGISLGSESPRHRQIPRNVNREIVKAPDMKEQGDLQWRPIGQCRNTPHKFENVVSQLAFDSRSSLTIEQKVDSRGSPRGRSPNISGQVYLRPSKKTSGAGSVVVQVMSNDEKLKVDTKITRQPDGKQSIRLTTPGDVPWWVGNAEGPCIVIRVTVFVPQNANIASLHVDVVQLDVNLVNGLVLGSVVAPFIKTISGNVIAPRAPDIEADVWPYLLQSRKIIVKTISGDVDGWFPLYDLLQIDTTSGDVDVQVAPEVADSESDILASLAIKSLSGTIYVNEPFEAVPSRDYRAKIDTKSGDIRAWIVMASRAEIESFSGALDLQILPVLSQGMQRPTLRTKTKSGDVTVGVRDPVEVDSQGKMNRTPSASAALSQLQSSHQSISGDSRLFYPASWTGKFRGTAVSGKLSARGRDLQLTPPRRRGLKLIEGQKGNGQSIIEMKSISGSTQLQVGSL